MNRRVYDLPIWNVPGQGEVTFSRKAVSRRAWSGDDASPFGDGHQWIHSFQWQMFAGEVGEVTIRQPSGYLCTYYPNRNGIGFWAKQRWWRGEKLLKKDGAYILALKSGVTVKFEQQAGIWLATEHRDARCAVTSFEHSDAGELEKVILPGGASFSLKWATLPEGARSIASVTTSDGRAVEYVYKNIVHPDEPEIRRDVLSEARYGDGTKAQYTYGFFGGQAPLPPLLLRANDPRYKGEMSYIRYEYEGFYGMISKERSGTTDEMVFERINGLEMETGRDGYGVETHWVADPETGGTAMIIEPCGTMKKWTYDPERPTGRFSLSETTGEGNTFEFSRSVHGDIMQRCTPECLVVDYKRDWMGRVTEKCETPKTGEPRITRYTYSYPGGLSRTDYPDGTFEERFYTTADVTRILLYKKRLRSGAEEHYEYDDEGRMTSKRDAAGGLHQWEYDDAGRVLAEISPLGARTSYAYDERGNVISKTLHDDSAYTYKYDYRGNLIFRNDTTGRNWRWEYDEFNRVTVAIDPLENKTTYSYDGAGGTCGSCSTTTEPTLVISPTGIRTVTIRDEEGRVTSVTKAEGTPVAETTTYEYDCEDNVVKMVAPNGAVTTYEYDAEGRRVATVQAVGELDLRTEVTYDDFGQVIATTSPLGHTTKAVYDRFGRRIKSIDPAGHATEFEYDELSRLASQTDALGRVRKFSYDTAGRRIQSTYADGTTTQVEYDQAGNMIASVDQLGQRTTYLYDIFGRRTTTVLPNNGRSLTGPAHKAVRSGMSYSRSAGGRVVHYKRDLLDRVVQTISAPNTDVEGSRSTIYDAEGRIIASIDELGHRTETSYDELGRRIAVKDALGRVTSFQYSADRRSVTRIRPDGRKEVTVTDALGRTRSTTDALGQTISYQYEGASSRRTVLSDAKGNLTQWNYYPDGLLKSKTYANGDSDIYAYDAGHQLISHVQKDGNTVRYTYDNMGRQTSVQYSDPDTQPITRTFDAAGRLVTESNGDLSVSYLLNPMGQPMVETQTFALGQKHSFTIKRKFDMDGLMYELRYPDQSLVEYKWNARGHLQDVLFEGEPSLAHYDRYANGLIRQISYENGTFTTNAYDAANQLETTAHFTSAPRRNGEPADEIDPAFATPDAPNLRVFAAHSYELDVLGRRTKQTFANGRHDAYRYDATGQVVGADYALRPNGNAGQSSRTQQFNYDAMGNRLSFIDSGVETRYTPNNVNQYTDVSAATSPPDGGWRYDARGNLRSDGSRRFRWDGEDRLIRLVVPNAAEGKQRVDYTYDSKSRRMIRKQGREHTLYIYDKWNCIAEYRVTGRNADSVLTTRYVWGTDLSSSLQGAGGVGGLLHADQVTNGQGRTKGYYFHYDGNGNVTAATNAKGRRAASYTYDAFGNTLESKGNYAEQNSYRFSTKPLDEVTGFYYYGYRYYDPVTGRWPSRDPIEERGGVNLFCICANNALERVDRLGRQWDWLEQSKRQRPIGYLNEMRMPSHGAPAIFLPGGLAAQDLAHELGGLNGEIFDHYLEGGGGDYITTAHDDFRDEVYSALEVDMEFHMARMRIALESLACPNPKKGFRFVSAEIADEEFSNLIVRNFTSQTWVVRKARAGLRARCHAEIQCFCDNDGSIKPAVGAISCEFDTYFYDQFADAADVPHVLPGAQEFLGGNQFDLIGAWGYTVAQSGIYEN